MTYIATVTRENDAWLGDVVSVPGAHTFARSLQGLVDSLHDVVVLMDDLPDGSVPEIDLHFAVEDDKVAAAEDVRRRRRALAEEEAQVIAETTSLVKTLTEHYSVRDTAAMLGVTPGRVSQITRSIDRAS